MIRGDCRANGWRREGPACKDAKRGVKWIRVVCGEAVSGAGHSKDLNRRVLQESVAKSGRQ